MVISPTYFKMVCSNLALAYTVTLNTKKPVSGNGMTNKLQPSRKETFQSPLVLFYENSRINLERMENYLQKGYLGHE